MDPEMTASTSQQTMDFETPASTPEPIIDLENASAKPPEIQPLGIFSKLRPEIRALIWGYAMPEKREEIKPHGLWHAFEPARKSRSPAPDPLGILRTNRAVSDEFAEDLYRERALCFSIHPDTSQWTVKNLDLNPCDLLRADILKFPKIRIEIYGPRKRDPAQLLVLGNNVLDLIAALRGFRSALQPNYRLYAPFHHLLKLNKHYALGLKNLDSLHKYTKDFPELPEIELVFLEHGSFSWFNRDIPRKSVKKIRQFDLEHILDLFRHLKNARGAKVILPSQAKGNPFLEKCAANMEESMQSRVDETQPGHHSQEESLAIHSKLAVILDNALDGLPGPTARNLRLHRFANWHSYNRNLMLTVAGFDLKSKHKVLTRLYRRAGERHHMRKQLRDHPFWRAETDKIKYPPVPLDTTAPTDAEFLTVEEKLKEAYFRNLSWYDEFPRGIGFEMQSERKSWDRAWDLAGYSLFLSDHLAIKAFFDGSTT